MNLSRVTCLRLLTAVVCAHPIWISTSALAQQTAKPPAKSADSELLKELESDLLKDLPAPKGDAGKKSSSHDQSLRDDLQAGEETGSPPEHPLQKIGRQMRAAQERIAQKDTSLETQSAQGDIVRELEKLIEQANKRGGGGNKSSSGKGTGKPGVGDGQATPGEPQDSTDRVGKPQTDAAQTADVHNILARIWGHLPEKMRDEMQSAISDQFLPKYEKLIEEYYKRLAEERLPGP